MDEPLDPIEEAPAPLQQEGSSPFQEFERRERQRGLLLGALRASFLVLVVATVALTLASAQATYGGIPLLSIIGTLIAAIAAACIVVIADVMTPRKHMSSVLGIYIGISFGLVAALGLSALIDIVVEAWEIGGSESMVYLGLAKGIGGLSLVYLSVSIVLTTKDDFRVIIPYVQFERRAHGVLPLLLDTSALIDGRIVSLARTGVIDAPIMIERFVIDELQALSDSGNRLKRERGRRGLDVVQRLQEVYGDTKVVESPTTEEEVDRKIIQAAQREGYRIVTNDSALAKIAQIQDIQVLNVNEVAGSLRMNVLPGDKIDVEIVREGESDDQGIAFLPDGTMIVIENAGNSIGENITVEITNSLQRAGGRLVFGRAHDPTRRVPRADIGRSAVEQAPAKQDPEDNPDPGQSLGASRNPRRRK